MSFRYRSTGIEPYHGGGVASGVGGGAEVISEAERIRAQQQEMISEQDEGLMELSRAAKHQRQMGLAMQDEVKEQNG